MSHQIYQMRFHDRSIDLPAIEALLVSLMTVFFLNSNFLDAFQMLSSGIHIGVITIFALMIAGLVIKGVIESLSSSHFCRLLGHWPLDLGLGGRFKIL